jgi:hypothetical protein
MDKRNKGKFGGFGNIKAGLCLFEFYYVGHLIKNDRGTHEADEKEELKTPPPPRS